MKSRISIRQLRSSHRIMKRSRRARRRARLRANRQSPDAPTVRSQSPAPAVRRQSPAPAVRRRSPVLRNSPVLSLKSPSPSPSPPSSPMYASVVWDRSHWMYLEKLYKVRFNGSKANKMEAELEKVIEINTPTEERMQQVYGINNKFVGIMSSLGGRVFLIGSHEAEIAVLKSDVNFLFILKGDQAFDSILSALRDNDDILLDVPNNDKISGQVISANFLSFTILVNNQRAQFPSVFLAAVVEANPVCRKFLMLLIQFARTHDFSSTVAVYLGVLLLRKMKVVPDMLAKEALESLADLRQDIETCKVAGKVAGKRFKEAGEDLGTVPISVLLHRFFVYFGFVHDFDHLAVSVRGSSIVRKEEVGWKGPGLLHVAVVDPFQPSRNACGDVEMHTVVSCVNVFRAAAKSISEGKDIGELFGEFN